MKYSPRCNEELVRVADLHPLQDDETVQGILEVLHRFERMLCEISASDRFSFQPAGTCRPSTRTRASCGRTTKRAGERDRDEIVTTIFSHPCDGAGPATAGFRVITVYAGDKGYPEPDAIKAAVSERTAGLMITNPEDTGLFNLTSTRSSRSSTTRAASATTTRRTRTASSGSRGRGRPASTSASSTSTRRSRPRTARWGCRAARRG